MKARRAALAGAALSFAAAVVAPARAGEPPQAPSRPAAAPGPRAEAGAPAPRRLAQARPAAPAASPKWPAGKPPAAAPGDEQVDDALLEFLGSVGDGADEDGDWLDFLASTDVDKVAKRGAKSPAGGK